MIRQMMKEDAHRLFSSITLLKEIIRLAENVELYTEENWTAPNHGFKEVEYCRPIEYAVNAMLTTSRELYATLEKMKERCELAEIHSIKEQLAREKRLKQQVSEMEKCPVPAKQISKAR